MEKRSQEESTTYTTKTYQVFDCEAWKDIVEIDKEWKTKEKAGRIAPGVFLEAIASKKCRKKTRERGKERRHF
jgi:hypothetical protein